MKNVCPHTQNVCPVLVNLERLSDLTKTSDEAFTLSGISKAVEVLLSRGFCRGPFSQDGDETDIFYSGVTTHCGNRNVPEVADKIDEISEQNLLSGSEIFEVETIGKIRS